MSAIVSKGRGALSNPPNRFHEARTVPDEPVSPDPRRRVTIQAARSAITRNGSPDVPFDQSVNPYRGCEHGCIYCFARPSHAFLDLSPGLDFETRLFARENAPELLARELARPAYRCEVLAIGPNTDAYQPIEKRLTISRRILEVCLEYRQPVALISKSGLLVRDLDLLAELARDDLVSVTMSLTTRDRALKRILEPRAADHESRLAVLRALAGAGVPCGALLAPIIPRINDEEIERLAADAAAAGATRLGHVLLRLPHEVAPLFTEWLEAHFPDRAKAVLSLIRQSRGGRDYDAAFGRRMRGTGHFADLIAARVARARERFGLTDAPFALNTGAFRVPDAVDRQLSLF